MCWCVSLPLPRSLSHSTSQAFNQKQSGGGKWKKKGEKIWNVPRSFVFLAPDPPAEGISRQAFCVCGGGWWIALLMFACSAARPSMPFPTVPANLPTVTTVNAFALWACDYIPRSSQFQVSTSCFNNTHLLSANITTLYSLFVFTFIPASTTVSFLSHFFSSHLLLPTLSLIAGCRFVCQTWVTYRRVSVSLPD